MVSGAIRAKARFVALAMALAVGMFVYAASDTGQPMWLIVLIGVLGSVLIGFFIALVWFWLRFFSHFGPAKPGHAHRPPHPEALEGGGPAAPPAQHGSRASP